jgi:ribonucleoside-diphosphate reductase alpha chain
MTGRLRLPNRRRNSTLEFEHAGMHFTLCAGMWPDGRIAEVFISSSKPGSPIEAIARDAAVTVSIALQFGADLETIRGALTRDHDGGPATLLSAALDAIEGGSPQ